jgi:hypothetical protein
MAGRSQTISRSETRRRETKGRCAGFFAAIATSQRKVVDEKQVEETLVNQLRAADEMGLFQLDMVAHRLSMKKNAKDQMHDKRPDPFEEVKFSVQQQLMADDSDDEDEDDEEFMFGQTCNITCCARKYCSALAHSVWFDRFILMVILCNCVLMIMDLDESTALARTLELVFVCIFGLEVIIKALALSFAGYWKSNWNILDLFVWLSMVFGLTFSTGESFQIARLLRILRPLKTIKSVPEMRIMVIALLSSFRHLLDVLALFSFLLLIFGIIGVQTFGGQLTQTCFDERLGYESDPVRLCSFDKGVGFQCLDSQYCANTITNPVHGTVGFDNILIGWLTVFQALTLEGWSDIMYSTMDVGHEFSFFYFVSLILFGSFFALNLVTAVIFLRFEHRKRIEEAKVKVMAEKVCFFLQSCTWIKSFRCLCSLVLLCITTHCVLLTHALSVCLGLLFRKKGD